MTIDPEAVAEEAKSRFTLRDRLQNRDHLEDSVTVFIDDVLGKKHAQAELDVNRLEAAKAAAGDDWSGEKELVKARKAHAALTAELKRKRVTLHLQAVPSVITDGGRRVAKKFLGIKGSVPEEREDDVTAVVNAHLLSSAVTSWYDHEYDETNHSLELADAVALRGYLPPHEKLKLDIKLGELQYANTISATVTNDPDF